MSNVCHSMVSLCLHHLSRYLSSSAHPLYINLSSQSRQISGIWRGWRGAAAAHATPPAYLPNAYFLLPPLHILPPHTHCPTTTPPVPTTYHTSAAFCRKTLVSVYAVWGGGGGFNHMGGVGRCVNSLLLPPAWQGHGVGLYSPASPW